MINKNTIAPTLGRWRTSVAAICCVLFASVGGMHAAELQAYSKAGSYEDVRFELNNAIVSRGLVIDSNGQVSAMLERTGADVGSTKPIYKKAEYFTFCSAKLSRAMMEADAANVGLCPYVVFIYETEAAPGTIHVGYRRLGLQGSAQTRAALSAVEKLLDEIAKEAVQ